jgi:hypothetical protein
MTSLAEEAPNLRGSATWPQDLLLRVLGFLPRNEVATTARQLCKDAHLHFRDKTVVHLKDADLPFDALQWAFLNSLATIRQRSQLLDCRAAAGDMAQVDWLVVGWQEAVRACSDGSREHLTGWSLLWKKPHREEGKEMVRHTTHQASSSHPTPSSSRGASAAQGRNGRKGRSGAGEQSHADQEPLVFCPWLHCTGEVGTGVCDFKFA